MTDTPARPVRVPNVSPGARSGLSGEVIGANAQAAYDENVTLAQTDPTQPRSMEWVREGETEEERSERADAVYASEAEGGADDERLAGVARRLREAVYGPGGQVVPDVTLTIPEGVTTVPALLAWVHEPEAHDQQHDRSTLVLDIERAKPEDEQRSTLVEPLAEEYPPPVTTVTTTEPSAPTEVQQAIASPPSPTLPGTTVVTGSAAVVDLGGTPT